MYVEIHARSEVNDDSPGKRMWVNCDRKWLNISVANTAPSHLNAPRWHLELKTTAYHELSSGLRGGDYKGVIRNLEVHLTPEDVEHIVNFALANQLVNITTKATAKAEG